MVVYLRKVIVYNLFVFMHVVRKHANNVFETRAFDSFMQKKQAIIDIRTLRSQPTVAGCHYEESSFFLIFQFRFPLVRRRQI